MQDDAPSTERKASSRVAKNVVALAKGSEEKVPCGSIRLFANAAIAMFLVAELAGALSAASLTERPQPSNARHLHDTPEGRAVEAALHYFPTSRDWAVEIIDPEFAADPAAIRALDAFIIRDDTGLRRKVYVNRESKILQQAARG